MTKFAIIGAMKCEIEALLNLDIEFEKILYRNFTFYKGNINNKTLIIAESGVGKTASACCSQCLIDKFEPDFIINTGVAGGIDDELEIGDIVLAVKLVYHDFDATALGYAKGYICNNIDKNKPTFFKTDEFLTNKIEEIASKIHPKSIKKGIIATGDMFVGTFDKKQEIKKMFNAKCSEMEGASIAHVANLNNIPCAIVRAISDLADGRITPDFAKFEVECAKLSSKIIKELITS